MLVSFLLLISSSLEAFLPLSSFFSKFGHPSPRCPYFLLNPVFFFYLQRQPTSISFTTSSPKNDLFFVVIFNRLFFFSKGLFNKFWRNINLPYLRQHFFLKLIYGYSCHDWYYVNLKKDFLLFIYFIGEEVGGINKIWNWPFPTVIQWSLLKHHFINASENKLNGNTYPSPSLI